METYPLLKTLTVLFEQLFYVRSDVMLCVQAFNMASKMVDIQIVRVRSFLLLQ